jgi:hypothetical protein
MPHPIDSVSVQFISDDGSLTPDSGLFRWGLAMDDAMGKSGRVKPSAEQLKTRLEKAGFVDVQYFTLKQPVGPWAKAKYGCLNSGAKRFEYPEKKTMLTTLSKYIDI